MTTGIGQAGLENNPTNPRMNELNPQARSTEEKKSDGPVDLTDTVRITANLSEKTAIEFEPIDEEKAAVLAQLAANDLNRQSVGMSSGAGTDALRAFI